MSLKTGMSMEVFWHTFYLILFRRIEQRTCDANLEQGILLEIITILIVTIFIQK